LIHKLVDQIGGADSEFIAEIKADMVKPEKTAKTIGDALDELVFGELPGEDQDEFKMVAKEVESKQKAGWNLVESQWRKAMAKTKAKKRPKAKAKPKCRGNFGRRKRKAAEMAT
jgi:uncharacterized protein YifE (UPF0438 family)